MRANKFLEGLRGQGCEVLDSAGCLDHFANVDISPRIRPDAVRRDEVTRQDRIGAAKTGLDIAVEIADRDPRDRIVAHRRHLH